MLYSAYQTKTHRLTHNEAMSQGCDADDSSDIITVTFIKLTRQSSVLHKTFTKPLTRRMFIVTDAIYANT